jgi:hypothetical protein
LWERVELHAAFDASGHFAGEKGGEVVGDEGGAGDGSQEKARATARRDAVGM